MKKFRFLIILPALFLLTACSFSTNTKNAGQDKGGVFVSSNKGDVWRQMSSIPTISANPGSIAEININKMVMDPNDSGAVYLAMEKAGLYYTYNVANGWNKISALSSDITVNDVAIGSQNKCLIFTAMSNKLYKSIDCGRSFVQTYFDNNTGIDISSVAIDHYDNNIIYLGTSRGDVLRSFDGGVSWKAIQRLSDGIKKILINPNDSRLVFIATVKSGIYKFNSSGGASLEELEQYSNKFDYTNWTDYNSSLKEFNLGVNFKNLIYSTADNSLLIATDKVILRSYDEGESWTKLALLTPEKDSSINDIAVNAKNGQEIYYVTNTSFYRSSDGGSTWTVKNLPTTRAGSSIIVDFNNPNIVYLGIKKIEK
ncbi:MAG TPA: hypothetical protein PLE28_02875 [bacterium]|nr:hypothetical protein [bacterium]